MTDYSKMTSIEFDSILEDLMHENANTLLAVPGAYEVFSEHFNNEILDRWEKMSYEAGQDLIGHFLVNENSDS